MRFWQSRSLFERLVTSLGLVLVLSIGCGAWLSIWLGRDSMRTQMGTELQSHAVSVLTGVEDLLEHRRTDARVWASIEAMEDVRTHDRDLRIETLLLRLQHEYAGAYRELTVLDSSLTVVASTRVERIDSRLDLRRLGLGERAHGTARVLEGLTRIEGQSAYCVATPIRSQLINEDIGWLVAFADWHAVEHKVRSTRVAGEAGDAAGFLVLADSTGRILAGHPDLAQRAGVDSAFVARLLREGAPLAETPGAHRCVAAWAAGRAAGPASSWRMIALHDKKLAFAVMDIFVHAVFLAVVLGLLVACVVSVRIARSVSQPVGRLVEATQRVAQGELEHRVPEEGVQDLRELARSFNVMAAELVDARERLQSAWRKEELLLLRSQFLSQVSHELRTPVTAILNYTDILRDKSMAATDEERSSFLDIVYEQSRRLMRLINDLLDTAKMEAGTFECNIQDVELPPVIQRTAGVVRRIAAEKGVQLSVEVPVTLPLVRADAERVEQVLSNLLGNAAKFTPAGGRIVVVAGMTRSRRAPAVAQPPASGASAAASFAGLESDVAEREQYVAVSVQDSGIGIPDADRVKIFKQFVQLSAPTSGRRGAGLGLTIAASIVVQHGGAIWVESQPGHGSTFHFTLPAAGAAVRGATRGVGTRTGQWNQ